MTLITIFRGIEQVVHTITKLQLPFPMVVNN